MASLLSQQQRESKRPPTWPEAGCLGDRVCVLLDAFQQAIYEQIKMCSIHEYSFGNDLRIYSPHVRGLVRLRIRQCCLQMCFTYICIFACLMLTVTNLPIYFQNIIVIKSSHIRHSIFILISKDYYSILTEIQPLYYE